MATIKNPAPPDERRVFTGTVPHNTYTYIIHVRVINTIVIIVNFSTKTPHFCKSFRTARRKYEENLSISNFKLVRCVVFEFQRSVTKW